MNANELLMDAARLRAQAKQCRELALAAETSAIAAEQLVLWAEDYEQEAAVIVEKAAAIVRFSDWLHNARSCPTGLAAGTPRWKPGPPNGRNKPGYRVRSRALH
jgi:hypothetical protein